MPQREFVGHSRELAALHRELDGLGRPEATGRVLLVSADQGVGKTRLPR